MKKSRLLPIFGFLLRQRFLVPCHDSGFSAATGVRLVGCFWVAAEPLGSMSRHGFPCVGTWFLVLSYRKYCNRFGLAWGFYVAIEFSQE